MKRLLNTVRRTVKDGASKASASLNALFEWLIVITSLTVGFMVIGFGLAMTWLYEWR